MIQNEEILIQVKGIGFTFLIDKRMKHNLISPALLAFFNLRKGQMYSLPIDNIREVNTKPTYNSSLPFLPDYVNAISFDDVFHYVGKKIGRCSDNKLRECKVFRLVFEYEECTFSFLFLLDKNLDKPALIGEESFKQIIKSVMEQKQET